APKSDDDALGSGATSVGVVAGAAALVVIRAIICTTVTVSLSAARISVIVPDAGAGSSISTLSVEISTTVSPSLTASPTFTDHSKIVPSVTDSPPVGVTMSIVSPEGASAGGAPAPSLAAAASASVAAPAAASSSVAGGDSADTGIPVAAPSPSAVVIRPMTWPTVTVSPSCARISVIVPEAG